MLRHEDSLSRRRFVQAISATTLGALPVLATGRPILAQDARPVGPTPQAPSETAVARFFQSLKPEQREQIAFPFDHPLRSRVGNNWAIVKPTISDLTKEQQALCREIFDNLTSEEGRDRFHKHMEDDYGGFDNYHVAVFGEPGSDRPFEWVLTGRHETIRADGNSVSGVAFGGPIFYGHDVNGTGNDDASHSGNVWWYQGAQANKVFRTFDDKQQARALISAVPADAPRSVKLRGDDLGGEGMPVADLDPQQKQEVRKLLESLLSPFRTFDVEEVQTCLKEAGGVDRLRLTFYKEGDIGDDGTWDNWKLEGPAFAWFFRCSPHAHVWLNVARDAKSDLIQG